MAAPPVIWHNPRCSKSRAALELLRERGVEPVIVNYMKNPPDTTEISRALDILKLPPRELMRRDEPDYVRMKLDDSVLTREQLIAAMAAHPTLIQRPIVFAGGNAVIGRPPEAVLAIL